MKGDYKMTRKEKFFEMFPEASRTDDNIPSVSPCQLNMRIEGDHCNNISCFLCRREFWNYELNEKEPLMNF